MQFEELKNIIQGETSSDEKEIFVFSRDASIFEIRPSFIVKPKNTADLKTLVRFVSEKDGVSLTARSGGTDMTGGPLSESIVLDFTTHFNKILEVGDDYAITEPGVFYRDFEKETLKKNLLLPSYPASREICTVGGMVANNAGGEKSLKYGQTTNYVRGLNVVLSDGNEYYLESLNQEELENKKGLDSFEGKIYREIHELLESNFELIQKAKPNVSKNSAGYALWDIWNRDKFDLSKLFVGSQGTLGLITQIRFNLIKPNKHSSLLVLFLKDLKGLGELVNVVNSYRPESFESYDDNTFRLAPKMLPGLVKKLGIGFLFRFIPDLWAIITGGIPKLVMLVEFSGDNMKEVSDTVEKCHKEVLSKFAIKALVDNNSNNNQKYLIMRRESFNLLRKYVGGKRTAPFIDDFIVRPEFLPEFLPRLNEILNQYKDYMIYTIAGHPGDGNFHIIPLMDLSDDKARQIIPELSYKVYELVLSYKGSITAEHNDGLIRTPYLEKMYGREVYSLFEKTKQIFDPKNIFNPRKKVNADIVYNNAHILRK